MASDRRSARLSVLALVAVLLFGALGTRMWFLQVVDAPALEQRVVANKTRTVKLLPERGRIFDRDGRIVADNERILTVTIDWDVIGKEDAREVLFSRLSGIVGMPVDAMEDRFDSGRYSPFLPLPLAEDVSEQTALYLTERIEDFPGVDVTPQWRREYPFAPLAAHVVGYMGAITEDDQDQYRERGYELSERVGRFGVERSYESALRGVPGFVVYEVDAAGRVLREVERVEPVAGNDLLLAIDLDLQQYAEQTLETQLRARRSAVACQNKDLEGNLVKPQFPECQSFKAPAGSIVVLDHSNGQVLALASYPTFDNRWFNAGISGAKFTEIFPTTNPDGTPIDPDQSILVNRAIQGQYNMGSTFKPFVAYSALNTGMLLGGVNYYYEDQGSYILTSIAPEVCATGVKCEFRNATCKSTGRPCQYGNVNVEDALAVSSDAFFYKIGEESFVLSGGAPILQEQVRLFSFGEKTGIDLPYEFSGRVPDKDLKRELFDRGVLHPSESANYLVGDNVQLAIGQGLLAATPLQLAVGYSMFANGGFRVVPGVALALLAPGTPDGVQAGFADLSKSEIVEGFNGIEGAEQINMPPEIQWPIVRGLSRVVAGPGVSSDFYHSTTGEKLFRDYPLAELPIAGKTGTAQGAASLPWNDSSAFAAFSLDPDRPYTVVTYLEKSGYGSQAAAPVTKCMFLALDGRALLEPVLLSDPLDLQSTLAAPSRSMPDSTCLGTTTAEVRD